MYASFQEERDFDSPNDRKDGMLQKHGVSKSSQYEETKMSEIWVYE